MDRRTFLSATLVAGISGCSTRQYGSLGSDDDPSDCREETEETTPEIRGEQLRTVRIGDVDPVPIDDFSLRVDLPTPVITTEHTAEVRITAINTRDRMREIGTGRPAPFATRMSEEEPGWVFLSDEVVNEENRPERIAPDCWQPEYDDSTWYYPLDIIDQHELDPCEHLSVTYELWSHHENDSCMPVGEYRFEDSSFEVYEREDEEQLADPPRFDWGFTLVIED